MKILDEPDTPAQINIVPMIDVIFAVLAFLIVSSLFLTRSEGLPVSLPEAGTAELSTEPGVVVTIDATGAIAINQVPTSRDSLAAAVDRIAGDAETPTLVVLNADEQVSHGVVVAVMDELRKLDDIRLGIATRQPQPQP